MKLSLRQYVKDRSWRLNLFLINMQTFILALMTWEKHLFILPQRMVIINASSFFLIDMPISMLFPMVPLHYFMRHQNMATFNASSFFLIDMPISMLFPIIPLHLFIMHHTMSIINASRFFLIDTPIPMLVAGIPLHHFIMHQNMAIVNASSFFLIGMPISMLVPMVPLRHFIMHQNMAIVNASSCWSIMELTRQSSMCVWFHSVAVWHNDENSRKREQFLIDWVQIIIYSATAKHRNKLP